MGLKILSLILVITNVALSSSQYDSDKWQSSQDVEAELSDDIDSSSESDARDWLEIFNREYSILENKRANLHWEMMTDIGNNKKIKKVDEMEVKESIWRRKQMEVAEKFNKYASQFSEDTARQLFFVTLTADSKNQDKLQSLNEVLQKMATIYNSANICIKDACDVGITAINSLFSQSRDYDELLYAWKAWRDATGKPIRNTYSTYVDLMNSGARENGFKDVGEYWRTREVEDKDYDKEAFRLWETLKPFYVQLHAYVRHKLTKVYPEKLDKNGPLPAHILGNLWGQSWQDLAADLIPYPDVWANDQITSEDLLEHGYTPYKMFTTAENFFLSIGLYPMTRDFWHKSIITKPKDKPVACHGSAEDFANGLDFRIRMCTEETLDDFKTVHHEMGHIEYFMSYSRQPQVFKESANMGFHEALGDTIGLSVMSRKYLSKLGLIKTTDPSEIRDYKSSINTLMKMALEKVAFLPYGLIVDLWRWKVFSGEIKPQNYNKEWWNYRLRFQGVTPPINRTDDDFDPGAKYHVPNNVPYFRYFLSHIFQFQFHDTLCKISGHQGDLHKCDIYDSKDAGQALYRMMNSGRSLPWPVILKEFTGGEARANPESMLNYFKPLIEWLNYNNKNEGIPIGWNTDNLKVNF